MIKKIINKPIVFGTGGWRAKIGDGFDRNSVERLAQALVEKLEDHRILIAYDRRFLSKEAAVWAACVFAANDIVVYLVDEPLPTPITMFAVGKEKLQYGMSITASHNPAFYNGVKVFIKGGQDAPVSITSDLAQKANQIEQVKTMSFDQAVSEGKIIFVNPTNDYLDHVLSYIDVERIRKARLKVLLDPMYGVSKTALSTLLHIARCDVDVINERHDVLFGGQMPSPELDTLEKLQILVRKRNYHIGIATDGDADRVGIVDEQGQFIHPNILIALIYHYLLEVKGEKGPIVRNLATSHLLDAIAYEHGEYVVEVPVGFKYISDAMKEHQALIGGESSGGITIRNHILGKDGIFSAMILMELVAYYDRPLSEIVESLFKRYGRFYSYEKSYPMKKEFLSLKFNGDFPQLDYQSYEVSELDGLKVVYDQGDWVCIRPSGTEPVLRIIVEAKSATRTYELMKAFEEYLFLDE